jgi:copper homeostasis protein
MPAIIIEACVNSALSAINAEKGGARRVELCDNLPEGGTTPSAGMIAKTREATGIALNVMIRPRSGDFCYSETEFDIMKEDVRVARERGANGFVAGILLPDGRVDVRRMEILMQEAGGMELTFHRAFDMTSDKFKTMEDLIGLGAKRILTSGGKNKATEGAGLIRDLIMKANGRIIIMPGSGVDEHTIAGLKLATGAGEFHVSGRSLFPGRMEYRNMEVSMGGITGVPEYDLWITDPRRIRKIVELAQD